MWEEPLRSCIRDRKGIKPPCMQLLEKMLSLKSGQKHSDILPLLAKGSYRCLMMAKSIATWGPC